jgi:hypothetical protein
MPYVQQTDRDTDGRTGGRERKGRERGGVRKVKDGGQRVVKRACHSVFIALKSALLVGRMLAVGQLVVVVFRAVHRLACRCAWSG